MFLLKLLYNTNNTKKYLKKNGITLHKYLNTINKELNDALASYNNKIMELFNIGYFDKFIDEHQNNVVIKKLRESNNTIYCSKLNGIDSYLEHDYMEHIKQNT